MEKYTPLLTEHKESQFSTSVETFGVALQHLQFCSDICWLCCVVGSSEPLQFLLSTLIYYCEVFHDSPY